MSFSDMNFILQVFVYKTAKTALPHLKEVSNNRIIFYKCKYKLNTHISYISASDSLTAQRLTISNAEESGYTYSLPTCIGKDRQLLHSKACCLGGTNLFTYILFFLSTTVVLHVSPQVGSLYGLQDRIFLAARSCYYQIQKQDLYQGSLLLFSIRGFIHSLSQEDYVLCFLYIATLINAPPNPVWFKSKASFYQLVLQLQTYTAKPADFFIFLYNVHKHHLTIIVLFSNIQPLHSQCECQAESYSLC